MSKASELLELLEGVSEEAGEYSNTWRLQQLKDIGFKRASSEEKSKYGAKSNNMVYRGSYFVVLVDINGEVRFITKSDLMLMLSKTHRPWEWHKDNLQILIGKLEKATRLKEIGDEYLDAEGDEGERKKLAKEFYKVGDQYWGSLKA